MKKLCVPLGAPSRNSYPTGELLI